MIKFEPN